MENMCYEKFIRPILFRVDPERVHNAALFWGSLIGKFWIERKFLELLYSYKNERLNINIKGINFESPVGLAAGFDKNGVLTDITPGIGFGFHEVGSITANECRGNPKPRLFRVPEDEGIIVNYGLPNEGSERIAERKKKKKFRFPIVINIAKTDDSKIKGEDSIEDYYNSYTIMKDIGSYITINISCPNVGDGRSFEDPKLLEKLLKKIGKTNKIIFLKLSPDINKLKLNKIISLSKKYSISGFVISNLTHDRSKLKNKEINKGGAVSGKVLKDKSDSLIKYVYRKTKGRFVIIGVGGIFNAEDAYKKIRNGASLVQLITGMIYKGPGIVKDINKGLVKLLEKDNLKNIKEAVGLDA